MFWLYLVRGCFGGFWICVAVGILSGFGISIGLLVSFGVAGLWLILVVCCCLWV